MINVSRIFIALVISPMLMLGVAIAVPAAGDTMRDSHTGMQLVWVPQGCFQPGILQEGDSVKQAVNTAADQQLVTFDGVDGEYIHEMSALDGQADGAAATCLNKGFWMGKFEVTQGQYEKIMGTNPSGFKKGDNYPVERVRWFDVRKFIRNINKATGRDFRLPSEAEWEYAARSGGQNQQYGGSGSVDQSAWFMRNSRYTSHPVGQKQANALGLHDMSGNVWEWTQDCWNEQLADAPKDGSAWTTGRCTARVLRGGSWYDAKSLISTTARLWNDSDKFDNNSGFRLVHD